MAKGRNVPLADFTVYLQGRVACDERGAMPGGTCYADSASANATAQRLDDDAFAKYLASLPTQTGASSGGSSGGAALFAGAAIGAVIVIAIIVILVVRRSRGPRSTIKVRGK